jgi:hypothetical protein
MGRFIIYERKNSTARKLYHGSKTNLADCILRRERKLVKFFKSFTEPTNNPPSKKVKRKIVKEKHFSRKGTFPSVELFFRFVLSHHEPNFPSFSPYVISFRLSFLSKASSRLNNKQFSNSHIRINKYRIKRSGKVFSCISTFLRSLACFMRKKRKSSAGFRGTKKTKLFRLKHSHLIYDVSFTHLYVPASEPLICVTFTPTRSRRSFATIKTPSLNLNNIRDFSPNENLRHEKEIFFGK